MTKKEILHLWARLTPMRIKAKPIPYGHKGSAYDCDGIRITGSEEFIPSVLSNLKDLLKYEGPTTRLQVTFQDAKDKLGRPTGSKSCYIQVYERGPEAKIFNTRYGYTPYDR